MIIDRDSYIKKFYNLSLLEQLNEIKIHSKHAAIGVNYMEQQIIRLGYIAITAGTPEFQEFKDIKI